MALSRFLLAAVLLVTGRAALAAAEPNPTDLVRRAIRSDELGASDPALRYKFTERFLLQNLATDGRVKSSETRTREMRMADFLKRRERFQRSMREIPEAFVFAFAGEETIDSRVCYLVEASPKPGYDPVDRYSRLFTQVKGRLWIDKQTSRWVKLEAELLDTVTFGWILVRIHKGSRVRMTQKLAGEEAWLPAELWYRVSLRIGLVSLRFQESETRYGSYTLEDPADPPPS